MKKLIFICLLCSVFSAQAQNAGEQWTQVRGVNTPASSYGAFVEAPNGTLIAGGPGARLMLSNDGGTSWRYEAIRGPDGRALFGTITDLILVEGNVVGSLVRLIPSSNRFGLPYEAQTLIISSSDNGTSWSHSVFPIRAAFLNGLEYPGLYLSKLFYAANGELLAYGSTVVASGGVAWFIGGAIFRQTGATWEQAYFERGAIQSMIQAGGRLAASGLQTVLDSADGRGWNGYSTAFANMNVDGQPLGFAAKEALNASDLAFVDGEYVMQAQQYLRLSSGVFLASTQAAYIFGSPNPFDGGRIWNGTSQTQVYPNWRQAGGRLISVGRGAYYSDTGLAWALADSDVFAGFGSFGAVGSQSAVAVGNSDNVWRSADGGLSWEKIFDVAISRDQLIQTVRVGDRLLARVGNAFIWSSADNGATWTQLADIGAQTGSGRLTRPKVFGDRVWAAQGDETQIIRSDDAGKTWQAISIPTQPNQATADVVVGLSDRIIIAPESRSVTTESSFFTSDDDGQSWQPRPVSMLFAETPKQGLHVGGGRIVFLFNSFASFDPELFVSDDNGTTWRREVPFQGLEDLNTVSGDPSTKVLDMIRLFQTSSGRLVILGNSGEILVSDDLGSSWRVVINYDKERDDDVFLNWDVTDIAETTGTLIVAGSRRSGPFPYDTIPLALVSRDDGDSWREIVIDSDQIGFYLVTNSDGSVALTGSNGSVFLTDPNQLGPEDFTTQTRGREGELIELEIQRPPIGGALSLSYVVTPLEAEVTNDFLPIMGELDWSVSDNEPKVLTIETVDDDIKEPSESLQIDFRTDGELLTSFSYRVFIDDDDGGNQTGIALIDAAAVVTDENGAQDSFRVALDTEPAADVTLVLSVDDDSEITFQPSTLLFTSTTWKNAQTVIVGGLDDLDRDFDRTVRLSLTAQSDDLGYSELIPSIVYVVNLDNEIDEVIFQDGFE